VTDAGRPERPAAGLVGLSARLLRLLPPSERRAALWLFLAMLLAAVLETLGVASIMPFMAVVMDPEMLSGLGPLREILASIGVVADRDAVVAIGLAVFAILVLSNVAAALSLWMQHLYLARVQHALSDELFGGFLAQPYGFHVMRDAASLSNTVFSHVNGAITQALAPMLLGLARVFVVISLLALLVAKDPVIALAALGLFGVAYAGVYGALRGRQTNLGSTLAEAAEDRYRVVLEALGAIKELLVLGRSQESRARFNAASLRYFRSSSLNSAISVLPRYLLESVAFGGIVLVTILLVLSGGGMAQTIPTLALYAFAGYRMMPALQQIYASAVALRFAGAAVDALERDLVECRSALAQVPRTAGTAVLPRDGVLAVRDVTFSYPSADRPALHDVSLEILPRQTVGVVGRTGSGKTTLADLLLGLYEPASGVITYGGQPLTREAIASWRQQVGYVPQGVFLANASIAENIALGVPAAERDLEKVRRAAQLAQADEFISALPLGYDTDVGERGVRLSGGQRQRLGIARALYHDPSFLVFDEATSALDGMTEEAVMSALRRLSGSRTIFLIAHRLRTVESCDQIFVMEAGRLVAVGTYAELERNSAAFRRLLGPDNPTEPAV
jgi:ABC-type multidrug transport system fused ATPase/permease subunit